jgi:hypothetical protein
MSTPAATVKSPSAAFGSDDYSIFDSALYRILEAKRPFPQKKPPSMLPGCQHVDRKCSSLHFSQAAEHSSAGLQTGCPEGLPALRDFSMPTILGASAACEKCGLEPVNHREWASHCWRSVLVFSTSIGRVSWRQS